MVKRLIIILSMFALIMCGAVFEMVYSNNFLSDSLSQIDALEQSMILNEGNLNNPETLAAVKVVEDHWKKGEKIILMISHHTIIRNACERVVALGECVRQNQFADSMVNLKQSRHYIEDLQEDNSISITNFL